MPEGMAVRLKFNGGPLSEFQHDERRFVRLGPDEWATPLYAVAAYRCPSCRAIQGMAQSHINGKPFRLFVRPA